MRAFLEYGQIDGITPEELADLCNREVQKAARKSLRRALTIAERFAAAADPHCTILRLTASRAVARISHMKGDHQKALDAYIKARVLARSEPLTRARIDRSLIDVYMYLGRFSDSRKAGRRAMQTFHRLGAEDDLAKTKVNSGNLLHRQDRHEEAEVLYREAAEYFSQIGDSLAEARCNFNRANALVQMFDIETAHGLYLDAEKTYEKAGYDLDACDARYGRAWLLMLTGEFHPALVMLTGCQRVYEKSGDKRGAALCIMDRAEAYLSLGLYSDALPAARDSERRFRRLSLRYESAKSALFRGQAAHAMNLKREARDALQRASDGFSREKNAGFCGVVHLLAADIAGDDVNRRRFETRLARRRFARAQLPMWEAVADLYSATEPSQRNAALRRLARNRAVRHIPQLFAIWKTLEGDHQESRGQTKKARAAWKIAADRLDAVRAQLPPPELRMRYGRQRHLPHTRLIESECLHNPYAAAAWSERYKTAGVWAAAVSGESSDPRRRLVEKRLDALARQVAALTRRFGTEYPRRGGSAGARKRLTRLQQQTQENLLAVEKTGVAVDISLERIMAKYREVSKRLPIVQFHIGQSDIIGFVHRGGDVAVHHFYDGRRRLDEFMKRWRFILEGTMLSEYFGSDDDYTIERNLWMELGEWLWRPLEIASDQKEILILPEGELSNIPWGTLPANGSSLFERHHVIIAPSLRHYCAARAISQKSGTTLIFRGRTENIPEAAREVKALHRSAGGNTIVFDPCRRDDWPAAGDASIWHFSGHARLQADNPFYSYLELADGPLFAADFRLKKCRVNLVTLAGCRSGQHTALPGDESTGLVRSLLEMGARTVIAGLWPVSDTSCRLWMEAFYAQLFGGAGIADAVRRAVRAVRSRYESAYHWAPFAVFGAGEWGDTP